MDQWEMNEPQLEIQPVVPVPTDGLGVLKVKSQKEVRPQKLEENSRRVLGMIIAKWDIDNGYGKIHTVQRRPSKTWKPS